MGGTYRVFTSRRAMVGGIVDAFITDDIEPPDPLLDPREDAATTSPPSTRAPAEQSDIVLSILTATKTLDDPE